MATTKVRAAGSKAKPVRQVTVMVNGQVVGSIDETGTIGEASKKIAGAHGLRAFSLKLNGTKLTLPDANKPLKGAKVLELYAKDACGLS